MQVTKADKVNSENLIRILKRAKLELAGAEEILGTAEVLRWMGGLVNRIDEAIKAQEEAAKTQAAIATATAAMDPVAHMTLSASKSPKKSSKVK